MKAASRAKAVWSSWRHSNYRFFENHLISKDRGLHIVDLGCGECQFAELFKKFHYTGVDFQPYESANIITDLNKPLPIPDRSADVVTLSNTLEHLPDPRIVLRESCRILRHGGAILGTVPFLAGEHQEPYDFNRYTHFQLEQMLGEAGFAEVEVVPLGQQTDVYNTIELKVFDELRKTEPSILLEIVRSIRRAEMRLIRRLFRSAAGYKITEGYGFRAARP